MARRRTETHIIDWRTRVPLRTKPAIIYAQSSQNSIILICVAKLPVSRLLKACAPRGICHRKPPICHVAPLERRDATPRVIPTTPSKSQPLFLPTLTSFLIFLFCLFIPAFILLFCSHFRPFRLPLLGFKPTWLTNAFMFRILFVRVYSTISYLSS